MGMGRGGQSFNGAVPLPQCRKPRQPRRYNKADGRARVGSVNECGILSKTTPELLERRPFALLVTTPLS